VHPIDCYAQAVHAPGLASWHYRYSRAAARRKSGQGGGLELGVQLSGEWRHRSAFSGDRIYRPGTVLRVHSGEPYAHAHDGRHQVCEQVGFVMYGEALASVSGGHELCFRGDAGLRDAELHVLAESCARDATPPPDAQIARVLFAYVRRHAELGPATPVTRARTFIEESFVYDLPIAHVAEVAGVSAVTLTRGFKKRYGVGPAAHRVRVRLNQASRLLWHHPEWSVERVGEEVGFRQKTYFHRAFVRAFGRTPGQHRALVLGTPG
jgi:AraC-like DNA-binding protein